VHTLDVFFQGVLISKRALTKVTLEGSQFFVHLSIVPLQVIVRAKKTVARRTNKSNILNVKSLNVPIQGALKTKRFVAL